MKKLTYVVAAIAFLSQSFAQASMWDSLSEANKTRLTSGRHILQQITHTTLHANERPAAGEDSDAREPIFKEVVVMKLMNATPAQISAAFSNYPRYTAMFGSAGITAASVMSGSLPNVNSQLTLTLDLLGYHVDNTYGLINRWTSYKSTDTLTENDSFKMTWVYGPSVGRNDNGHVYHIEGQMNAEPVVIGGVAKTLVKYKNYANPSFLRTILQNDFTGEAVRRNYQDVIDMTNALKEYVESSRNTAEINGVRATFCTEMSGTASQGCP